MRPTLSSSSGPSRLDSLLLHPLVYCVLPESPFGALVAAHLETWERLHLYHSVDGGRVNVEIFGYLFDFHYFSHRPHHSSATPTRVTIPMASIHRSPLPI